MTRVIGNAWDEVERLPVNYRKPFRFWPTPERVKAAAFALSGEKEAVVRMGNKMLSVSPQRIAQLILGAFKNAKAQAWPWHEWHTFLSMLSYVWHQTKRRERVELSLPVYQLLCRFGRDAEAA